MQGKFVSILLLFLLLVSTIVLTHNVQPLKSDYASTRANRDNYPLMQLFSKAPGDINGDGVVDGSDLIIIERAFGSCGPDFLYAGSPPNLRWNRDADINSDGVIDGVDLALAARSFCTRFQYVVGDKIIDGATGQEVMWMGTGGSYLFHAGSNYQQFWQQQLSTMQTMEINTVRLAFAFPDSTPNPRTGVCAADILNYTEMDWVINFLNQYGIKGILDCHNYEDMIGDFGSQKLINDWTVLAQHYVNYSGVAAYELFNEPTSPTWNNSSVHTTLDVVKTYVQLTNAIRQVDQNHIVIWESQPYTPPVKDIKSYLVPNMVFTWHEWYMDSAYTKFTSVQLSYMDVSYGVECRQDAGVPFWHGEFGIETGSPSGLCEQVLWRCEEQVIGWNLWCGRSGAVSNAYLGLFPLKIYNANLIRQSWNLSYENIINYITTSSGVDRLDPYEVDMWQNGDYIMLKPGITIYYERTQVQNGISIVMESAIVNVTEPLTLTNIEGTTDYSGDWNLRVYSIIPSQ